MTDTLHDVKSFILAEMPLVSALCPLCQGLVKKTNDEQDLPVYLSSPYQIRTIEKMEGRYFEKVDSRYLHDCRTVREVTNEAVAAFLPPESHGQRRAIPLITLF